MALNSSVPTKGEISLGFWMVGLDLRVNIVFVCLYGVYGCLYSIRIYI